MWKRIFFGVSAVLFLAAGTLIFIGVMNGSPLRTPIATLSIGAEAARNWVRHDDWGIETTFAIVQLVFISGLAAIIRWGREARKEVRDTEDQVRAMASDAAASLSTFLTSFDGAVSAYLSDDPYLKDIDDFDLKDQRASAVEAVRALMRKLESEIEIWRRTDGKLGNLPQYKEFCAKLLQALNEVVGRTKLRTLKDGIAPYRSEMDKFVIYSFSMHSGEPPRWSVDAPPTAAFSYITHMKAQALSTGEARHL